MRRRCAPLNTATSRRVSRRWAIASQATRRLGVEGSYRWHLLLEDRRRKLDFRHGLGMANAFYPLCNSRCNFE